MILLSYGFTFAVGVAVIILLIVAVTAIWERLHDDRQLKKLERERRSEPSGRGHGSRAGDPGERL
jgi:hypothetical protein